MDKKKDIYEIFNELDELLESVKPKEDNNIKNIKEEKIKKDPENKKLNIPDMPKVFFDDNNNPV